MAVSAKVQPLVCGFDVGTVLVPAAGGLGEPMDCMSIFSDYKIKNSISDFELKTKNLRKIENTVEFSGWEMGAQGS